MLFRKKIARACEYCQHGAKLEDDTVLCIKRGIVASTSKCRKFIYDPCKRIPLKAKALDFDKYTKKDFEL